MKRLWIISLFGLAATVARGQVTLTTGDAFGSSSFNTAGNWSQALAPHSGTNYLVNVIQLRTPPDGNSYTFAGDSLTIGSSGQLSYKGTGTVGTITVTNLILNGGSITHLNGVGDLFRLAGNLNITAGSVIHAKQGVISLAGVLSGAGTITIPNSDGAGRTLVVSNSANTYTGSIVNNGSFTLAAGANLNFVIGASGVNNRVSGTGASTVFNGRFVFDLSNASTNLGDSWTIASAAGQSFGSTFSVDGFTRAGFGTGAGTWDISTNGVFYEFVTSSGILSVVAEPSATLDASSFYGSQPFAAAEADVLVSYCASYASSVGGEDNAQVLIANAFAGSNRDNDQSGTGARMRIVKFYQSNNDVINQTTVGGIVNWLSSNNANLADVVATGAVVGADLVEYICQCSDSSSIAGVAQQPGMYSALSPGSVFHIVVAHETGGHNYGRSHSDGLLNPKTIMLHNYCGGGANSYYSNPKIWLNGVQLLGDGASSCPAAGTPAVNGGDNSLPSADSAQGVADRRTRVLSAPSLNNVVLRWLFTNAPALAPAGTTIADQISAAPAIVRGTNAIFTGNALRLPGGTTGNVAVNSMAAYIDLPNGILSTRTNITIEIWATPLAAPNWARLLDFGRTVQAGDGLGAPGEYTGTPGSPAPGTTQSSDAITLSVAVGTDINQQRFEAKLDGAATNHNSGLPTVAGVAHHYAVTFTDGAGVYGSGGGRWQWYRDGDLASYLDVNYHLSSIEDVNNWLGRSLWSDDSNANTDYAEVRIHNVALSRGEVLANFLLGPYYSTTATVTLTNSDAAGSSSFNAAGNWSNGAAPSGANSYETFDFPLRTPASGSSFTFGGASLKVSGGTLLYKGTSSSTITVTNLTLNGGAVQHAGSGVCTLAGDVTVTTNGAQFNAVNGPINLAASLRGGGPVTFLGNTTTLAGNNSGFTGKTIIGNGVAGTVFVSSDAQFGPIPATFTSDQVAFNRGTLVTTSTMTISNNNRGWLIDISGATFNVGAGTTLTLSNRLSSPNTAGNVVAGAITKTGAGTLTLNNPNNSFKGTLFVDTSSTSANDGFVKLVNNIALSAARPVIFIRNNNNGSSTFQLDGSAGNLTVSQAFSVNCRNSAAPTIQNLAGTNTISGFITLLTGGSLFNIQSDAGRLIFTGDSQYLGSLTGGRTYAFAGAGDIVYSGRILDSTNGAPISLTKSGSGVLTLSSSNTYAAGTTVNGGTLLVNGSITGAVSVAGGATLGGAGTINGAVTMANGATLSPGSSAGTLTVNGNLALNDSTTLAFELGASSDRVAVTGNLTLDGILRVSNAGGFGLGNYTLLTYTGSLTDNGLVLQPLPGGLYGKVVAGGGAVVLQVFASQFDAWKSQYFASTNCAACAGDADFDGDGLSNTNEFLAGFDPTNSAAYLRILEVKSTGDDIVVTYLGAAGDANGSAGPKTNVLEFTAGAGGIYTNDFASTGQTNVLNTGTGMGVVTNLVDAGGATNSPARYYRVRVLP
jgi:autotransporter-associated beta strand protein